MSEVISTDLRSFVALMRLNKPIPLFLLLWPTLWALWLAGIGKPNFFILCIFILGVLLMRSAGCIINDFADRHFDGHVARTRQRPLATGQITTRAALTLFFILCCCAFLLVLMLNRLTILLAFAGVAITIIYPFMKRFTHLPQIGLGIAFAWGVPMAFAAQTNSIPLSAWLVFSAAALWPVIYDTMYAMCDRPDDIKIGIKSTAILFGKYDRFILAALQIIFLMGLVSIGILFNLHWPYFVCLVIASIFCGYQLWLIKDCEPAKCLQAFLNNHWIGMIVFLGIVMDYLV